MRFSFPFGKAINVIAAAFLTLSIFGIRPVSGREAPAPVTCPTSTIQISLAAEQVEFCSPTSLAYTAVEDDRSSASAGYAGLAQREGRGFLSIRAASPGSAPGPGWPAYQPPAEAYREEIRKTETAQLDQVVTTGPAASLWGETTGSIQIDFSLITAADEIPLRTVEWFSEHHGRLWIFSLTWDISMANAVEWEQAAGRFWVQQPTQAGLPDSAVNLGQAYEDHSDEFEEMEAQGVGDVALPAWWEGAVCDSDNYMEATGLQSVALGAPWHGVYACGTNPLSAMQDVLVKFYQGAWGQYEFECVELVMRFLYLQWGIAPFQGNGSTIKDYAPSSMVFYANDGTHPIAAGDILTEDPLHTGWSGHAMVVIGVNLDGSGNGTIDILEQNSIQTGHRAMAVHNWIVDPDAWIWGQTVQGWLHAKANIVDSDPDPSFNPTGTGLNGPVNSVGLQGSGKIIAGGEFTAYDSTSRNHIARLNTDGSLDGSFNPGEGFSSGSGNAQVYSIKVQTTDDKILVGGYFDHYGNTAIKNILRLEANGGIDGTFTPPALMTATTGDPGIRALAVQPDGKVLMGGNFNSLDSSTHNFVARLNSTGAVEAAFSPSLDGTVFVLMLQADGKIIIGGAFSHVGTTSRAGIARLNANGTLDTTFDPGSGTFDAGTSTVGQVSAIAMQDDRIIIGGNFSTYNGTARKMIARMNSNGSLDTSFNPGSGVAGTEANLQAVALQPDGRILIGGKFSSYNGVAAYNFIRLNNDGTRDQSFFPRGDFASSDITKVVHSMYLQADNKILLAGNFSNYLNRLLNHVEPCYGLTVTATPPAGGSVSTAPASNCPGSSYLSGTSVSLTAYPDTDDDYWFINWGGDASGSANPAAVVMSAVKSISANFLHSPYGFSKASPANGSSDQPAEVSLGWGASTGATSYEYCFYISTNDCDSRQWISAGAALSASIGNLLPSTTYHWQVRARNQVDTTDAGPDGQRFWSFTRNAVPAVPDTIAPGGVVFIDNQLYFRWAASAGATYYELVIHPLSSTPDLIYDHLSAGPICSAGICNYLLPDSLDLGGYKFKVSASTGGGTSAFSTWRTFTIIEDSPKVFLPLLIR